jgi:hypothetical protein
VAASAIVVVVGGIGLKRSIAIAIAGGKAWRVAAGALGAITRIRLLSAAKLRASGPTEHKPTLSLWEERFSSLVGRYGVMDEDEFRARVVTLLEEIRAAVGVMRIEHRLIEIEDNTRGTVRGLDESADE